MPDIIEKENLSPVRRSLSPAKSFGSSPFKVSRKGRSKSIGPGAEGVLEQQKSASPNKNRRKSSFAPPVKSILPSKEEEAKRREARRKSLANRRVSFAPEATLHTWDVIEYMREATTSSTSSENTRRASRTSDDAPDSDGAEVPATPDDHNEPKKRRRSSAIPPLNFNDPDELYSSSPVSGSSPVGDSEEESDIGDEVEQGSDEDSAMSLISADNTAEMTLQSNISSGTSDSSVRLDAALRQAAEQAGTRGIGFDEFGDQSEELQDDPMVAAHYWARQQGMLTPMAKNLIAIKDQENVNPFSPAFKAHTGPKRPSTIVEEEEEEEEEDMSMDMTRAVGRIIGFKEPPSTTEDATMDFTQVEGQIYQHSPVKSASKRRRSTNETGSPMTIAGTTQAAGQGNQGLDRPSKRRRSSTSRSSMGDGTMDFTSAFGDIRTNAKDDQTMDFTTAIGKVVQTRSPQKVSRRQSVRRRRSSAQSVTSNEQTMDFTVAVGTVQAHLGSPTTSITHALEEDEEEGMSMELTTALGNVTEEPLVLTRPTTPKHLTSPFQAEPPRTPKDQERYREADDLSSKKLLTPVFMNELHVPQVSPLQAKKSPASAKRSASGGRMSASPARTTLKLPAPTKTPSLSPERLFYPELPVKKTALTPTPSPKRQSKTPAEICGLRTPEGQSTPARVLSSPFKMDGRSPSVKAEPIISPTRSPPQKIAPTMLDNIRTMSTPRKDTKTTPLKRLKEMTPKKTPLSTKSRTRTPLTGPTPRVQFSHADHETKQLNDDVLKALSSTPTIHQNKHLTLSSFLDAAGIRFMDLTATKRRYTAAPTPKKSRASISTTDSDAANAFAEAVSAGAVTLPELDLYAHSCRELKRYISEGKTFLKQLEADVKADPPAFMAAYVNADVSTRAQMDRAMLDVKTKARLQSKEIWYGWRTELLGGLQDGLRGVEKGLDDDEAEIRRRDEVMQAVLPPALKQKEELQAEAERLAEAARMHEGEDEEMLQQARKELVETDETVKQQRELLQTLQAEMEEQERLVEMLVDTKAEATAAIEEANRIKEASRAMSIEEAKAHQASLSALEQASGWSIASATASSLTLTYRSSLQLFFNPSVFSNATTRARPKSRSPAEPCASNAPISLSYVADSRAADPQPLTTEKRFFLQLLRAQLQMLDQPGTRLRSLLSLVGAGWDAADSAAETIRRMRLEHPVEVKILSDESLGVSTTLLLPAVRTKVALDLEVGAAVVGVPDGDGDDDDDDEVRVDARCTVAKGRVVYGEQYKEAKMGEFLASRIGKDLRGADTAVRELRTRLEKTGRKV